MASSVQRPPVVRGGSQRKQSTASKDTTDRKEKYGARKETVMRKGLLLDASQLQKMPSPRPALLDYTANRSSEYREALESTASRDTTDRKDKYAARKETAMRKASQLCTLTGNRVFAGIANARGNTVWPPDNYSELIGSYRLRRDIQSYQLLKEGKRKMPGDARKQDGVVSATFAPLSLGLLQNCVADLRLKLKYVDNIINSRGRDHDTFSLDASQLQKMPSPGPALLDCTANRSSEYCEALESTASKDTTDRKEKYGARKETVMRKGLLLDASQLQKMPSPRPALLDYTANRSSEYREALESTASRDTTDRKDKYAARKETAMRKASQLCTLTGNRVFAGIANARGNTVWPPDNYSELIGSYRLRRDIQSYQLLKEGKRKMPGDARKQDGVVSATFAPLSLGLLQNCVADLRLKLKYVDNIINSRGRDHDTFSLDASQLQKMPSPGPALLDCTENRSSEYREALESTASKDTTDRKEKYGARKETAMRKGLLLDASQLQKMPSPGPA